MLLEFKIWFETNMTDQEYRDLENCFYNNFSNPTVLNLVLRNIGGSEYKDLPESEIKKILTSKKSRAIQNLLYACQAGPDNKWTNQGELIHLYDIISYINHIEDAKKKHYSRWDVEWKSENTSSSIEELADDIDKVMKTHFKDCFHHFFSVHPFVKSIYLDAIRRFVNDYFNANEDEFLAMYNPPPHTPTEIKNNILEHGPLRDLISFISDPNKIISKDHLDYMIGYLDSALEENYGIKSSVKLFNYIKDAFDNRIDWRPEESVPEDYYAL